MNKGQNKYNSESSELKDLENKGWQQMQSLLDEHLPQEKRKKAIVIPFNMKKWIAIAAMLIFIIGVGGFLFLKSNNSNKNIIALNKKIAIPSNINSKHSALQTGNIAANSHEKKRLAKNSSNNNKALIFKGKMEDAESAIIEKSRNFNNLGTTKSVQNDNINIQSKHSSIETTPLTINLIQPTPSSIALTTDKNIATHNSKLGNIVQAKDPISHFVDNAAENLNEEATDAEKKEILNEYYQDLAKEKKQGNKKVASLDEKLDRNRNVDFTFYVNRNTSTSNKSGNSLYDIPVYPSLQTTVHLNSQIGLSTGLAINAPGQNTNFASSSMSASNYMSTSTPLFKNPSLILSKDGVATLQGNFATARYEVSNAHIQQAYYWQVPFLINYSPISKLKFSGGANLAFAQKVLISGYNPSTGATSNQLINPSDISNAGYSDYSIKTFDPRVSVGAEYKWHNTLFGAHYTQSLSPAIESRTSGQKINNQIFSISIGYNLFH